MGRSFSRRQSGRHMSSASRQQIFEWTKTYRSRQGSQRLPSLCPKILVTPRARVLSLQPQKTANVQARDRFASQLAFQSIAHITENAAYDPKVLKVFGKPPKIPAMKPPM